MKNTDFRLKYIKMNSNLFKGKHLSIVIRKSLIGDYTQYNKMVYPIPLVDEILS